MTQRKLNVGDIVGLTKRAPLYMFESLRINRPRKIIRIEYDPELQASVYYLGSNATSKSDCIKGYPFRSYQLKPYTRHKKSGRPRTKRNYRKRVSAIL